MKAVHIILKIIQHKGMKLKLKVSQCLPASFCLKLECVWLHKSDITLHIFLIPAVS